MLYCLIAAKRITSRNPFSSVLSMSLCRQYASRGRPKKPPSEITIGSEGAPTKDKIKKKTKRVSKAAPKEPVKSHDRKTTLEVGTSFELRSLKLLQDNFSMTLDRVAGPGDGGVDLIGWWWLPRLPGLPGTITQIESDRDGVPQLQSRIRVLAQCKAEKNKMGPNYVREMEGVLHRVLHPHSNLPSTEPAGFDVSDTPEAMVADPSLPRPIPTIAMIISQSRFTNGAVTRAMSSPIPFILLHLPPEAKIEEAEEGEETDKAEDGPSLQWNPALGSEKGLLGGSLEVRWQREAGGSYPRLWWQGQPMEACVPSQRPDR
jgi:Protein of unknown function (DUF2034)